MPLLKKKKKEKEKVKGGGGPVLPHFLFGSS
jgi:hypothetical protein